MSDDDDVVVQKNSPTQLQQTRLPPRVPQKPEEQKNWLLRLWDWIRGK